MIVGKPSGEFTIRIIDDPVENAKAEEQRKRFRKNSDWLQAHIPEVYSKHRGKCICVAGQELFVADSALEARAMAKKAHPQDNGAFIRYIPLQKMARIYAHQR